MTNNIDVNAITMSLECDNCDYIEKDFLPKNLELYIDKPCPNCGMSLLTKEDYINQQMFMMAVGIVNGMDIPSDGPKINVTVNTHKNLEINMKKVS